MPGVRRIPSGREGPWPSAAAASKLLDLSAPHVESINYMMEAGLATALAGVPQHEVKLSSGDRISFWLQEASIGYPTKPAADRGASADTRLYPAECRERGLTYAAPINATLCRRVNGGAVESIRTTLGDLPIMVRSSHCRLAGMNACELVSHGEEASEFGGYFICNGIERIVRMLQIPKRNHPMAITRGAYTNRGPLYSNKGIAIRCVRPDQSAVTITLHYLTDGSCTVRFAVDRQEFFLPVILVLKALVNTSDREIYERVLAGDSNNTYLSDRVLMLLRDAKRYESALHSRSAALAYLGARFRSLLSMPASLTDEEAGQRMIDQYILVHLPADAPRDKFNLFVLMLRKLYGFVRGDVLEDSPDSLCNQELLLTGHLLLMAMKEKLEDYLQGIEDMIVKDDTIAQRLAARNARTAGVAGAKVSTLSPPDANDALYFKKVMDRQPAVGKKLYYLLATGNLITRTGLDLMQVSGYSVVADKINFMRFTTHFRSVHRGQFFAEQKTTAVRKLLPENWGFLCPIHTPDGGPCGLLNHLSAPATVVAHPLSDQSYADAAARVAAAQGVAAASLAFRPALTSFLVSLGMTPYTASNTVMPANHIPIMLDGCVLGGAPAWLAYQISRALRRAKALTALVTCGIDRVGAGILPEQREAVTELMRASVLGFVDRASLRRRAGAAAVAALTDKGAFPAPAVAMPAATEIAFLPPPWWDAEVDPFVPDATAAAARAAAAAAATAAEDGTSAKLVGLFPGLFISSAPARLVRPVVQLDTGLIEVVSPMEQPYLDIACTPEDVTDILHVKPREAMADPQQLLYTHIEMSPTAMLSEAAALTPFSDLNQSPRNMYQCQMGKQTMGTPLHAWPHRADTKHFRLQNPQAPIVQNAAQAEYAFDEYPSGANAVVAVIAYTGYDMEDACIVNKSSYERGFGHASVYKCHTFDLQENLPAADMTRFIFHNSYVKGEAPYRQAPQAGAEAGAAVPAPPARPTVGSRVAETLDEDGLPPIGLLLRYGDPIYVALDTVRGTHKIARHKEQEPAYVDEVRILAPTNEKNSSSAGVQRVSIKLRFNRNPVVGDKFSSRHGQKGVLSFLWPQENMPFTDSGMTPDVIINPHAFPSRMTIGMLIESMAGKAGACHGMFQDSTPFRFNEEHRVVDYFGEQLKSAGYAYYGTETMYSGVTGEPLHCDIYLGVVYYQRLRHMINDKAQARATGPINQLTRQPVKGRKKHGGIRFGEMERDSLLAHGASFVLHDRLHNSSDRHIALVCKHCGSLLSPYTKPAAATTVTLSGTTGAVKTEKLNIGAAHDVLQRGNRDQRAPHCTSCGTGDGIVPVPMPYVFRYLAAELAAMNIKLTLQMAPGPYEYVKPAA